VARRADGPIGSPLRVLVVNQTATMSGGEHSLLTLLAALDARDARIAVASPLGDLSQRTAALGMRHVRIAGTEASFRLDVRTTPRELASLALSAFQVARAARRLRIDVVHANTTRAGLIAIVARALGAPAPLVHVRDWTPPGRAADIVLHSVARGAADIVANSRHVANQFDGTARTDLRVIHNPIELARFDPARHERSAARARLGIADCVPLAGVVGQLTPWKGQDDAIRSLAVARRSARDAMLVIAGSAKFTGAAARFDNAAFAESLPLLTRRLGLGDAVNLLGEVDDVPGLLAALDVLLVPSWEEAFGRVVVEGMAMGLPVIATASGGPPEIIDDGRTGFLLAPRDPEAWGGLLADLLRDPAWRANVGEAARVAAMQFAPETHADAMLEAYRAVAR
jgi:glycosyltransferase involved in cell wall biosynthesis